MTSNSEAVQRLKERLKQMDTVMGHSDDAVADAPTNSDTYDAVQDDGSTEQHTAVTVDDESEPAVERDTEPETDVTEPETDEGLEPAVEKEPETDVTEPETDEGLEPYVEKEPETDVTEPETDEGSEPAVEKEPETDVTEPETDEGLEPAVEKEPEIGEGMTPAVECEGEPEPLDAPMDANDGIMNVPEAFDMSYQVDDDIVDDVLTPQDDMLDMDEDLDIGYTTVDDDDAGEADDHDDAESKGYIDVYATDDEPEEEVEETPVQTIGWVKMFVLIFLLVVVIIAVGYLIITRFAAQDMAPGDMTDTANTVGLIVSQLTDTLL